MDADQELITVFRSVDHTAEEDAEEVRDLLEEAGIRCEVFDSSAPGVPTGAIEVRVPAPEAERAAGLIREETDEVPASGDTSHALDLATIFSSDAHNAEMEALAVRGVLDASGIPSVVVGAALYPNLPSEVRVPRALLEEARRAIEEARRAGPSAAEEAEKASEK